MRTQRAATRKPDDDDFGQSEKLMLAKAVVEHLVGAKKILAIAESCTGGLISAAITEIPGASKAFAGGAITYSNEIKAELLGIPECLIAQHGAVSAEVAAAMAAAVAEKFGADYGLASTGFAGPGGGTEADPVGTVYFGYHSPAGLWACRVQIDGDRATVRERAVEYALNWMRRKLKKYQVEDLAMTGLCD
jgi:nicotinamide-nucleotide amidase